jgi:DNA-binding response OmpR family regulator
VAYHACRDALGKYMRILLLEDDKQLGPWIAGGLREEGHVVDHFEDGKDALIAAMGQDFDLLILDRMVPGLDGLSVLKSLRASRNSTPALFLTALGEVDARVEGFEAGGDDYLTKPFAFAELSARVGALGRRRDSAETAEATQTTLKFADLSLDLLSRRCERQGQPIELMAKEFKLLEYLMRRPGRLVTRTMLLEQVWDMSFDPTTSVVETHISRLRAKIDKPFDKALLRTRRGEGYVFGS